MEKFQYTYPDGRIDTRPPLWREYYAVTIPYIQMRSVEDLERYGVPTTGFKDYDKSLMNAPQRVLLPIVEIAEYYEQGAQVAICDRNDTKSIYDAITAHLNAWKDYLMNSMNVSDAPLKDLLLLDRFAHTLYDHAKYHYQPEFINSIFARMSKTNSVGQALDRIRMREQALRAPAQMSDRYAEEEVDHYPKRQALAEYFGGRSEVQAPQTTKAPSQQSSFADLLSGRKGWGS